MISLATVKPTFSCSPSHYNISCEFVLAVAQIPRGPAPDRKLHFATSTGQQLPLQAAASANLEHRPVRLADREFKGGSPPLALKRIGEGAQPVRRDLWLAEKIGRADIETRFI